MKASLILQPLAAARWTLASLALGLTALMLVATSTYETFGGAQILSQRQHLSELAAFVRELRK